MEVILKVVVAVLNSRLLASITFHNFLHGFRAGHGTDTAILEAKLIQQLAALRDEVLYVIFLDLHKAYDALDKSRCLDILEGYGVGLQSRRMFQSCWRRLTILARAGVTMGRPLRGEKGLHRAIRCPPPYLMWWWTRLSATG